MNKMAIAYKKKMLNPILYKLGMFYKLPSVFFWGIRLEKLDSKRCEVTIPYSWRTQNPFSSIYFAALAGAAELSTGALCQQHLSGRDPHSMLVVNFQMNYLKKANTKVTFICDQGHDLEGLLDTLKSKGDGAMLTMNTVGHNIQGDIVCNAEITWSFKKK